MSELRAEFLRLLTVDGVTKDRRRKDHNQAIFDPAGHSIWSSTDLGMVMEKFDRAAKNVGAKPWIEQVLVPLDCPECGHGLAVHAGYPNFRAACMACRCGHATNEREPDVRL